MPMTDKETILNMNTTESPGAALLFQPALNRHLLRRTEAKLIFHQFGQNIAIPKGETKTITFRKMSPLPPALTPLTEGVTPVGNHINISQITATPTQHGDYIAFTDQFDQFAHDPPPNVLRYNEQLSRQAAETLDLLTQSVLSAGTNVLYAKGTSESAAPNSRSGLTAANTLSVSDLMKAVLVLKNYKAEPFNDGFYVAIVHPNIGYDLMKDKDWIDVKTYQDKEGIYRGEIGKLYGARIIESTTIVPFSGNDLLAADAINGVNGSKTLQIEKVDAAAGKIYVHETISSTQASALVSRVVAARGATATVTAAAAGTNGSAYFTVASIPPMWDVDTVLYPGEGASSEGTEQAPLTALPVYPTYVIAKNAYGVSDPKGSLKNLTKPAGSAGTGDPLDQRSTTGWKSYHVAKILADEYMVRIESVATNPF